MEDDKMNIEEGKQSGKTLYIVLGIISADLLILGIIADLYFMITNISALIPIIFATVVCILMATTLMFCIFGLLGESQKAKDEQHFNEMKAQRALYLMLKKNSNVVADSQSETNKALETITREVVLNQKAASKYIVSRNKENTDALMNSNDIILEKLLKLLSDLKENQDVVNEQREKMTSISEALGNSNDGISKNDIDNIIHQISDIKERISNGMTVSLPVVAPMAASMPQTAMPMQASPAAEPMPMPEIAPMPTINSAIEEIETAEIDELPEVPSLDMDFDLSDLKPDDSDVVLKGLDEVMAEEGIENSEPKAEDDFNLDDLLSDLQGSMDDISAEPELAEKPIPEPVPAPAVEIPDDPNAVLTPEQIAALVAGNNEPEPEPAPAPAVEIPDDPNAVLTPEQIAVLVAGNSEPEPEPAPIPEMQATPVSLGDMDSNEKMTPEQIAELIASMGN